MAGAGSTLATRGASLDEATRLALANSIETKARNVRARLETCSISPAWTRGRSRCAASPSSLSTSSSGPPSISARDRSRSILSEVADPGELPALYVDGGLVVQVSANLVDNAAKYTPDGTHITDRRGDRRTRSCA